VRDAAEVPATVAADGVRTSVGITVWPILRPLMDQLAEGVRSALGEDDYRRLRAVGTRLAPSAALDLGLTAVSART
jgi:hypothetical protein